MTIRRGDVVTVAAPGDYGKPRPAVIVQSDAFPDAHASVIVCQMTSSVADAPDFRVTLEPSAANGLRPRYHRSWRTSQQLCGGLGLALASASLTGQICNASTGR